MVELCFGLGAVGTRARGMSTMGRWGGGFPWSWERWLESRLG